MEIGYLSALRTSFESLTVYNAEFCIQIQVFARIVIFYFQLSVLYPPFIAAQSATLAGAFPLSFSFFNKHLNLAYHQKIWVNALYQLIASF